MIPFFQSRFLVVLAALLVVAILPSARVLGAGGAGSAGETPSVSVPVVTFKVKRISIVSKNGVHDFFVEIATSSFQQQRGLMYRTHLAENRGMLFIFPYQRMVQMWMRNTRIPLDMLFVGKNNKIKRIASMTTPNSDALISSGVKVSTVLEVNGGLARKLGIAVGDSLVVNSERSPKK